MIIEKEARYKHEQGHVETVNNCFDGCAYRGLGILKGSGERDVPDDDQQHAPSLQYLEPCNFLFHVGVVIVFLYKTQKVYIYCMFFLDCRQGSGFCRERL